MRVQRLVMRLLKRVYLQCCVSTLKASPIFHVALMNLMMQLHAALLTQDKSLSRAHEQVT